MIFQSTTNSRLANSSHACDMTRPSLVLVLVLVSAGYASASPLEHRVRSYPANPTCNANQAGRRAFAPRVRPWHQIRTATIAALGMLAVVPTGCTTSELSRVAFSSAEFRSGRGLPTYLRNMGDRARDEVATALERIDPEGNELIYEVGPGLFVYTIPRGTLPAGVVGYSDGDRRTSDETEGTALARSYLRLWRSRRLPNQTFRSDDSRWRIQKVAVTTLELSTPTLVTLIRDRLMRFGLSATTVDALRIDSVVYRGTDPLGFSGALEPDAEFASAAIFYAQNRGAPGTIHESNGGGPFLRSIRLKLEANRRENAFRITSLYPTWARAVSVGGQWKREETEVPPAGFDATAFQIDSGVAELNRPLLVQPTRTY